MKFVVNVAEALYQLQVVHSELNATLDLQEKDRMPHVEAFFNGPIIRSLLRNIQDFIWTTQRLVHLSKKRKIRPRIALPEASPLLDGCRPKILLDVTNTHRSGFKGGIARVASQLALSAARTGLALPVVIHNNRLVPYFDDFSANEVEIDKETIYVVVDTFWDPFIEYMYLIRLLRSHGVKTILCIHDVMPLTHPVFFRAEFCRRFEENLKDLLSVVDGCLTVSNFTLNETSRLFDLQSMRGGIGVPIASFKLGADGVTRTQGPVRPELVRLLQADNAFVSVGTLEPRKAYGITLEAFDEIWRAGSEATFIILGQRGWLCKALEETIINHPTYGKRLHWIADASDDEISFAYQRAYCVIQASVVEGFGLPVVEASLAGASIIASNSIIFQEVGGENITFFENCDSKDLAEKISSAIRRRPPPSQIETLCWEDSLSDLLSGLQSIIR